MWTSNEMIAVYILLGIMAAGAIAWLLLRKTVRTRLRVAKSLQEDTDINDYLVIFDWSPKVLYVPTIITSFLAGLLMLLKESANIECISAQCIGGIFLVVFLINLLIEEYDLSVKMLLIIIISIGFLLLWLNLLGWVMPFLKLFRNLAITLNAMGFFLIAVIGIITIIISWLRGLFYYVTITPNYMNIQQGPTETGDHIGREDYNTIVDTSDFLERLMGFGKIIIIFKDMKRPPMTLRVWPIQKRAQMLEQVRGKFAIDLNAHQFSQTPPEITKEEPEPAQVPEEPSEQQEQPIEKEQIPPAFDQQLRPPEQELGPGEEQNPSTDEQEPSQDQDKQL